MGDEVMSVIINTENKFFDPANKLLLIKEIKKHPCLYNPWVLGHGNKIFRRQSWMKVAKACGVEGQEDLCKNVWKNLRDKYKRQREKWMNVANNGVLYQGLWSLHKSMNFIEPYLYPRTDRNKLPQLDEKSVLPQTIAKFDETETIIEKNDPSILEAAKDDENGLEDADSLNRMPVFLDDSSNSDQESCSFPTLMNNGLNLPYKKAHFDERISSKKRQDRCEDSIDLFFKSVTLDAKALPRKKRMKFQHAVMSLLCNALEESDNESDGNEILDVA